MNIDEYLDELDLLSSKLDLVVDELNELATKNVPSLDFENASDAQESRCEEVQERLEAVLNKLI